MDLTTKFKLPRYTKGKSFAEASKLIQKKFEGRNDPESLATKDDILGKLRDAQEHVKSIEEFKNKGQHQMPDGSMMPGESHGSEKGAPNQEQYVGGGPLNAPGAGPSAAGVAGAAAGGLDLITGFFDKQSNIDTDGTNQTENLKGVNTGGYAAKRGLNMMTKGAAAGASAGPLGAAVGGAVGLIGGFATGIVGGNKINKDTQEANFNFASTEATRYNNPNLSAYGGDLNTDNMASKKNKNPLMSYLKQNKYKKGGGMNKYAVGGPLGNFDPNYMNSAINSVTDPFDSGSGSMFNSPNTSGPRAPMITPADQGTIIDKKKQQKDTLVRKLGSFSDAKTKTKTETETETEGNDKANALVSSAMRLAPAAMNALQLSKLKKPGREVLGRLNTRYEKNTIDEKGLQNSLRENVSGNRRAIMNTTGGSANKATASLLASNVQAGKAKSNAYMQAQAASNAENTTAQNFNTGIDRVNLQQSNLENDINAKNLGAYNTQKSKLMAAVGNDIGAMGKEALYKKYPQLMGMDYEWLGNFINKKKKEQEKKDN